MCRPACIHVAINPVELNIAALDFKIDRTCAANEAAIIHLLSINVEPI